jgi:hypothetical protein
MRLSLSMLLLVCLTGFVVTSGAFVPSDVQGWPRFNPSALQHALPVLFAMAVPPLLLVGCLGVAHTLRRIQWIPIVLAVSAFIVGLGLMFVVPLIRHLVVSP